MKCKKCGRNNPSSYRNCIHCNNELVDTSKNNEDCPECKKPLLYPDKPCPYCNANNTKKEESICNKCKASLRKGIIFNKARKLDDIEIAVLGLDSSKVFCDKCIKEQKSEAAAQLDILKAKFNKFINQVPVITLQKPANYTIVKYCGVVTSQSAVGNIEAKDFNPKNSKFNLKFSLGEKFCMNTIKKEALKQGANAIIGCDIEYAELSNPKQTFMIAMMGTAVVLEEFEILTEYEQSVFNKLVN